METEFATKYKNFQNQVNDFQNKVQKGLMTTREAQELDQQLSGKRMDFENQRNDYLRQRQEENTVSQNKVINYIMKYLEEYNKDNKYEYILSYSFGGGVLFADDRLDITARCLKVLTSNTVRNRPQQNSRHEHCRQLSEAHAPR